MSVNLFFCTLCSKWLKPEEVERFEIVQESGNKKLILDRASGTTHLIAKGMALRKALRQFPIPNELKPETRVVIPESVRQIIEPQVIQKVSIADPVYVARPKPIAAVKRGKVFLLPVPWESPGQILSEGYRHLYFQEDIDADVYGLQYLALNEEVEFQQAETSRGNLCAKKIKPIGRPEQDRDHNYRDDAFINEWHSNQTGFATRPTGESVFVSAEDVITEGTLGLNVWIRMKPCPPRDSLRDSGRKMWRAKEVEIYKSVEEKSNDT